MFPKPSAHTLGLISALIALGAFAQRADDAVRVTVPTNPDGPKTVDQTNGANHQSIATTTTGAGGKPRGKIIYQLDGVSRSESGQVFAPDGTFRFKTSHRSDGAGRLAEETRLGKDDSVRNRMVYSYDAEGHQIGYALYDGDGRLLGRTTPQAVGLTGARREKAVSFPRAPGGKVQPNESIYRPELLIHSLGENFALPLASIGKGSYEVSA